MGSGFNFFTNAVDKTPGTVGQWVDVDVSSNIPSGSTGVILELLNTSGITSYNVAVRKNGSADDRGSSKKIYTQGHIYALCGVDANRIFEAYVDVPCKVYLVGYTDDAVTFETNAIDKSTGTVGQWVDVDISANAPADATGVIVEMIADITSRIGAIRKNGSTDDRTADSKIISYGHVYLLCGLDENKLFEQYISSTGADLFVVGYTKAPIIFFTNAIDKSLSVTSAWTDIDITADATADTDGAIFEMYGTSSLYYKGAIRKNGSTDDRTGYSRVPADGHISGLVGTDSYQILEGWIDNLTVDFYLVGYCKPAGQTYTKTWQTDVLFKKLGITKASAFDVAFKKSDITKTFGLDMGIQKRDIQLERQVDALVRKLDILKQLGVDVNLLKKDIVKAFALDACFGVVVSHELSRQIDVLLNKFGITKTFTVDVEFKKTQELQKQVDALFRKGFTVTKQVDALFKKLNILRQFNVDVDLIRLGISKAFAIDAGLGAAFTREISEQIDVLFKKLGVDKSFAVDADLCKTLQFQKQIDAFFRKTATLSRQINARFLKTVMAEKHINVFFKMQSIPRAFGVDAWIGAVSGATYTKSFAVNVMFRYKLKLPTPLGMTLDGQLVIPLKREVWIGD